MSVSSLHKGEKVSGRSAGGKGPLLLWEQETEPSKLSCTTSQSPVGFTRLTCWETIELSEVELGRLFRAKGGWLAVGE